MKTTTFTILAAWVQTIRKDGLREEAREYEATSLSEALVFAERDDAGRPEAPDVYGIFPEDFDTARAEGIDFNEADGLLLSAIDDVYVDVIVWEGEGGACA